MYLYSILLFIIILFILFLNPNNEQLGGRSTHKKTHTNLNDRPNYNPQYNSIELTTLDYNNVIFGELFNFILYNDEVFNLKITINTKPDTKLEPFYIDILNDKNDTDYILRINSLALENNNTIQLNNIGINTPSSNIITNNLNKKTSNTNYLKITPVKVLSVIDEAYSPLLIDSINVFINKNNLSKDAPKLLFKNEIKKNIVIKEKTNKPNILQSITKNIVDSATDALPECKSQEGPLKPTKKQIYKISNVSYTFIILFSIVISFIFGFNLNKI